ncbi:MAG TPA: PAS domain-containing sensor histidine kinase [Geminicoccaceae bacterium]|jgi:two-component system nitrogen regulation sensor histidine kinase NtrY|nr:PAS domain-containing sensor histidine kinase [Geminicoccaceae bacterium]HZA65342.1 PAS domain-containing sensor histidine kinase [Geminicoccaceae bacterium]
MASSLATSPRPAWDRFVSWLRQPKVGDRLALVLTAAATLSGLATYVVISGWLNIAADAELVLGLLYLDLILLLLLGVLVARRLVQLIVARRQGLAGSRLHARLVALFSLVAVAPAIVVAVFSVAFLHFGLEAWFSERISGALTNSLNVAQAYLEEHKEVIRADALAMAADLNREGPALVGEPEMFQRLLDAQAALRALTEAIVFLGNGQVVARSGLGFVLELERVRQDVLEQAANGEVVVLTSDSDDRVRALVRLDNFLDAYLYVGRFVDARVLDYMERTREAIDEYRALELRRAGIQVTFAMIFGVVALLLLLAAVRVGLAFANRLAMPISRLIAAADRVRVGDLTASVPEHEEGHEIDHLSRAFNRMTAQLGSQRAELINANSQLDERRRFTETVIGGVSAGVLGLDRRGRITLANRSAAELTAAPPDDLVGRPLIAVIPEVAGLLASVATTPERPAEAQIELRRPDGAHTLLVRVAAQYDGSGITGYVVTFDDITELLAAQRKAAWAEIARRIAHEIKNPLTPIRLSAERLRRKYLPQIETEREAFANSTDTIIRQVDGIGRLINEFSAFARMPAPVFALEPGKDLVRRAVYLQEGARPEISFETQLPEGDVRLYCDAQQVAQALTNLLQNAVESVLERLKEQDGTKASGWVMVKLVETRDRCLIEVHDNGCGLPEPTEPLTEPYVTTRTTGTGLGLAIVKKIMEEHGGSLTLRNRTGGGACATLAFPAVGASHEAAAE